MKALVTGVTGQDGSCLAEQLAAGGHQVYGLIRWQSRSRRAWVETLVPGIRLIDGDLLDQTSLERALADCEPDVVFNLAAIASSGQSWAQPMMMGEVNALGPLRLLEAIRLTNPGIRFVQASTSEQYGRAPECPQSENTPHNALNVYGIAKTFAHQATINYRDSFGLHASTALMHNHVSLRRDPYFVDRKISRAAARIALGLETELRLGNLAPARDWGWGPEYMQAWQLIAGQDEPSDYVIATGVSHTVRELVDAAFAVAGLDPVDYLVIDPELYRPTDVNVLQGDPGKARDRLGWKATVTFDEIVRRLVEHDLAVMA